MSIDASINFDEILSINNIEKQIIEQSKNIVDKINKFSGGYYRYPKYKFINKRYISKYRIKY